MIYAPSLACADQLNLASDIKKLIDAGFDFIHFDIMDGHYVPNLCLSIDTGNQLGKIFPQIILDVHVMVTEPESYVERIAGMGAKYMSFHLNATRFPLRLIQKIKKAGMKAGVVLNPSEPVMLLKPILSQADLVLLMSIEPGFAGQQFLEETYDKLSELACFRNANNLQFDISVDGGITVEIGKKLIDLGANILILGYPILFNQPDGIIAAWERAKKTLEFGN